MIEEVINQCLEGKEKVYVAYMDISKAFDTMGINSILFKLYHNKSLCDKAWRPIRERCIEMAEFVRIERKILEYTLFNKEQSKGVFSRHDFSRFSLMT